MTNNKNRQLCDLINDYRAEPANQLPRIPISMKLMLVATEHVKDLSINHPHGSNCNIHSWSNQGNWTGGCYVEGDPSTHPIMWNKPKEISNYPSSGYEIAAFGADPELTLNNWKKSTKHNNVILNKGIWAGHQWKALGAALYGGYACAWFGDSKDCFIATAAYGSPLADEVQFLRRYREDHIKRSRFGRTLLAAFEKLYYSFSPRLAGIIQSREKLRYLARIFVADPIVDMLLICSFILNSGRKRLLSSQKTNKKLVPGILMRGIGGWLYSISWIIWNAVLAYSFFNPETFVTAVTVWIPMITGLTLTRIGALMHKDIDFSKVTVI
jgi:hypothetical protein